MLNIHDQFRFFYNHPTAGLRQCYPANGSLEFAYEREKDQVFYRHVLKTALRFTNNPKRGITDFDDLYALERSADRCDKLTLTIERKCGEDWYEYWMGYIALVDGDYDVSRCQLEVVPRVEDRYSCLLQGWEETKDILNDEIPVVEDVRSSSGVVEEFYCTRDLFPEPWESFNEVMDTPPYDCGDLESLGYVVGANVISLVTWEPYHFTQTTTWVRERINSGCNESGPVPPEGDGWILIEDNCPTGSVWARPPSVVDQLIPRLPNGRRLTDVLQWLLDSCGLTLVSDFFNYNPESDAPDNFAYQYATQYLRDVVLFQITDVKNPRADEKATIANTSLKKLLDGLRAACNVTWDIDDQGNFRLEHSSFFSTRQHMLDLTQEATAGFLAGKHKYKYLSEELPAKEKFAWAEPTDKEGNDFDGLPIRYSETCSYDKPGKDVEHVAEGLHSNVEFIYRSPSQVTSDALVLVATKDGAMITEVGLLSGVNRVNGPFAFANLMYYLHRHGRPQRRGDMNGQPEQFYAVAPKREQSDIAFPLCCSDSLVFRAEHKVRTQLGWGEVSSASYRVPEDIMTLELLFE